MADTTALKNRIRAAVKANDNQEITGPVLQQALLDIVDELNNGTEAETSRAEGAESTLQQNITAEKNRAEGAESTLQQNITAETSRAEGAESTLQQNIKEVVNYFNGTKPSVCLDDSEADFNIVDILGYVLAEFKSGHIKTKNFDSRNILTMLNKYTRFSYTQQDGIFIADENGYVLFSLDDYLEEKIPETDTALVTMKRTTQDGLFISDLQGYVYVDFSKGMKTKYFDGRSMYPGQINKDTGTLTGCINKAYDMIHTKWPTAQVFVCSIMKHGRTMADANDSYLRLNSLGLSRNQYNKRIKECAELAGFSYIDLWGEMGIDPLNTTQAEIFFHNAQEIADRGVAPERINDRVHPIQAGHRRMAEVIYNHLVNAAGADGWQGKKAIFFGDSITDNLNGMHTDKVYYSYLTDWLQLRDDGMNPNGYTTKNSVHYPQNAGAYGTGYMLEWAGQGNLYQRIPDYNDDYDLVVILLGTNDAGLVLGEIYNY